VVPNKNTTALLFAMVSLIFSFVSKINRIKLTLFIFILCPILPHHCCLGQTYTAFPAPQMLKLAKQHVRNVKSVDLHPKHLPMTRCAPIVEEVNTKTKKVNRTAKVATWDDGTT
jgi:hypothetical protein